MPIYDYSCEKCGAGFEVERALGATGAVKCAACGSTRTQKVFSAAGIVFKGSGFYVTDSKGGGSTAKSDGGTKAESCVGGASSTPATCAADCKTSAKA